VKYTITLLKHLMFSIKAIAYKPLSYIVAVFLLFSFISFTAFKNNKRTPPSVIKNGGLVLPGGFEAVVVVDSLQGRSRHIAVNNNGDIYVKLRFPDSIGGNVALRDTNKDGRADIVQKFGNYDDKGSYGTAMRIHNGYLYFSSELNVFRMKLTPGKLIPEGEMEWILKDDFAHGRHEHITKPVAFDGKGHMFVPFGAGSNACQEKNRTPGSPGIKECPWLVDHAGIWMFDEAKIGQTPKDGIKYATGLRSIVALAFNSYNNSLYCLNHGRDDLTSLWPDVFSPWQNALLPSEEFFKVDKGLDGGWPYYYYDQVQKKKLLNPEYGGDGKKEGDGAKLKKPIIGFPGHWAPNDLFFYTGTQFPNRYKNGAFIAFHGSTNRAPYPQSGFFVAFVPFKNGVPSGPYEIFADNFAQVEPLISVGDAMYRPMGLAMGPDGSLYVSETEKGKIWKIRYRGDKNNFGTQQLASMERRKMLPHFKTPHEVKDNLIRGMEAGGAKIYATRCMSCHQLDGKGDGNRFPPLAGSEWVVTGRSLRDKERLIRVVLKGLEGPIEVAGKPYNNTMPSNTYLSDDDAAKVLTYIRNNFGNKAPAISANEVRIVRSTLDIK
jgi:glucose/arabinose dehydrogenase/mono/diheme cytochrome c family protein